MQQLEIEHKEITATSNQIVGEQQENKTKDRREGKGRAHCPLPNGIQVTEFRRLLRRI